MVFFKGLINKLLYFNDYYYFRYVKNRFETNSLYQLHRNKMKFLRILFLLIVFIISSDIHSSVAGKSGRLYLSGYVVIKIDSGIIKEYDSPVAYLMGEYENLAPVSVKPFYDREVTDWKNDIYILEYKSPVDPDYVSGKFSKKKGILWAEPWYLYEPVFEPNDPQLSNQYYLTNIRAREAWDISKGEPDVIIAIIDTGVDWDHPDLAQNIYENSSEKNGLPGVDDDGNGYIDDLRGWDFGGLDGTPDNNPMEDRPDHGTHVAGCAAAVTNNGIGVASIGYNSSIMPVKTSRDDVRSNTGSPLISYGYQGIIFAADNGADIINCSWGSFGFSLAGQEVINYAASKGALVVAAAGNNNSNSFFYPASFDKVLSVGGSTSTDQRWSSSNYGHKIDVIAPAQAIYNTWQNDTYISVSGTSMASPLTSGLAALVKAKFPNYTGEQVGEQIRINADDVDMLNPLFARQLGQGRINAFQALSNVASYSVRAISFSLTDLGDGDGIFEPGEEVSISAEFFNYLNAFSSVTVNLEAASSGITLLNSSFTSGQVGSLSSFNNNSSQFRFRISSTIPQNSEISFVLNYSGSNYADFQWLTIAVNPTYGTQGANDVALTITSKGSLGYNDYPDNLRGDGFKYLNSGSFLFEGAFMYGTGSGLVMDAARGNDSNTQNTDFLTMYQFQISEPGSIADQQGYGVFDDAGAGSFSLGIRTVLQTFSFTTAPDNKYIVLKYLLENRNSFALSNFYAGLFFDWDIDEVDYDDNVVGYDQINNFGYAYNSDLNPVGAFIGAGLISSDKYNFRAIDNDGTDFNLYDGFSEAEKFSSLSAGLGVSLAKGPADISFVVSGGPYSIPAGATLDVGFVIAAGDDLPDLQNSVTAAKLKYPSLVTALSSDEMNRHTFYLGSNYPNPFNPMTSISYSLENGGVVELKVFDILGKEIKTINEGRKSAGEHVIRFDGSDISSGVYFYQINAVGEDGRKFSAVRKMMLLK